MSTAVSSPVSSPSTASASTVRELAMADAKRFARHPLFIIGMMLAVGLTLIYPSGRDPDPVGWTPLPAFFLGVFGFVVAHRLTTSMRRTDELVDALPSSQRRRTLALCIACTVPFLGGVVWLIEMIVVTAVYPPVATPADAPVVWFGTASWPLVLAALVAMGPVAALGGPLLGVAVASWAPFRGSALVGAVLLVLVCAQPAEALSPWRAMPPWAALVDEHVVHGKMLSSTFVANVSPVWACVYSLLLCALAVVAALLRDPVNRRPLVWTGVALTAAATGALVMTVA
jgi:hypothetical protein